jgi:hypothetical protein
MSVSSPDRVGCGRPSSWLHCAKELQNGFAWCVFSSVRYLADGGSANGYRWYKVLVLSSGKEGFVASSLLSAPGGSGNPGFPFNVTVTSGPLNVRRYPTTSAAVVGRVQTGHRGWLTQRTFVRADGHQWAEVTFEGGIVGHVSMAYVKIT